MWKISLLDLCNDIKYSTEYKLQTYHVIDKWIDTFLMYIVLIWYLQQSL